MEKEKMVEVKVPEFSTSAANTLKVMANTILVIGIVAALVQLLFVGYNPIFFITSIVSIFYILLAWASLRVMADISLQLKGIQETMPLRLVSDKNEDNNITTGLNIGDRVTWKKSMTQFTVEDIQEDKVLLRTYGGNEWVSKDEIIEKNSESR